MKATKAKCGASNPPAMARGGMAKRRGKAKRGSFSAEPKPGIIGTPLNIEMIGGKKKKPKNDKVTVFNPKTGRGSKKVRPGKNVRYGGKNK
jgi:hypothetical protein